MFHRNATAAHHGVAILHANAAKLPIASKFVYKLVDVSPHININELDKMFYQDVLVLLYTMSAYYKCHACRVCKRSLF